jgi:hypothetical protein
LFWRHIAVEKVARQTGLGGNGPRKVVQCPCASEQAQVEESQCGHFPVKIDVPAEIISALRPAGWTDGSIVAELAR